MNLYFDEALGERYKSKAQKIRVMSECWVENNMFCPCCGNSRICKLKNNEPVADMKCENCGEIFELKSKQGKFGKKINDGAYSTMLERVTSITNPELFVMQYSSDYTHPGIPHQMRFAPADSASPSRYAVTDLTLIPKFFFVPSIIEKRKPLAQTARRGGWIGCNILYSEIPEQGKINVIKNSVVRPGKEVVDDYVRIKNLETRNVKLRSWLLDVLNCVNDIESDEFCLQEVYAYIDILQERHVDNHNIEAKIRQQLQFLRDKGFIDFLGGGNYKKRF